MPDMQSMMQSMMQNPAMQAMMQNVMAQPGFMESMLNMNPQLRSAVESTPGLRWAERARVWEGLGGSEGGAGAAALDTGGGCTCCCRAAECAARGMVAEHRRAALGRPLTRAPPCPALPPRPRRAQLANPEMMRQMLDPANMQAIIQMQQTMQQLQGNPLFGGMLGAGAGAGRAPGAMGGGLESLLAGIGGLGAAGMGAGMGAPPPAADPETAYATQLQQLQDMGFFDRETNVRALQATGGNVNAAVERLLAQF
jgi:ubiquilin